MKRGVGDPQPLWLQILVHAVLLFLGAVLVYRGFHDRSGADAFVGGICVCVSLLGFSLMSRRNR